MTSPNLTREDIESFEAGPELDALVAELVMGWPKCSSAGRDSGWYDQPPPGMLHPGFCRSVFPLDLTASSRSFRPSLHIAAAWEVLEELRRHGKAAMVKMYRALADGVPEDLNHRCSIYDEQYTVDGYGPTARLAICRAALLAVLEED